jgi:hypothetical protein
MVEGLASGCWRLGVLGGKVTASLVVGGLVVVVSGGPADAEVSEAEVCLMNGSVRVGRTIERAGVSATGKPPMPIEVHSSNAGTPGP